MTDKTILDEAAELRFGPRNDDYGHPLDDFSRTAKMWSAILDVEVTPQKMALCMICVKLSREVNKAKRDNLVDIAGYAQTVHMVNQEIARRHALDEEITQTFGSKLTKEEVKELLAPLPLDIVESVKNPPRKKVNIEMGGVITTEDLREAIHKALENANEKDTINIVVDGDLLETNDSISDAKIQKAIDEARIELDNVPEIEFTVQDIERLTTQDDDGNPEIDPR